RPKPFERSNRVFLKPARLTARATETGRSAGRKDRSERVKEANASVLPGRFERPRCGSLRTCNAGSARRMCSLEIQIYGQAGSQQEAQYQRNHLQHTGSST